MKFLQSFLLLLFPVFLIAQNSVTAVNALIEYTNRQLKTDDALVNGRPFIQKNIKAAGTPFFQPKSIKQVTGTVFTKGENFTQQSLRYNLETDALILSKTLQNGIPVDVALNTNIVDSFSIAQHFFINKQSISGFKDEGGYAERIFQGKFTFYRLQKIRFLSQFSEKYPNGKYTEPQTGYYVFLSDNEFEISSLKDFASLFPLQKKEIMRFAKKEKIRFRKASLSQLTQLMNFCNEKI
ncbi:MAG: hypothetical protein ACI85O_001352 [Saprospiraceae bacterium]|jgi:hypothetical protein